MSATWGAPPRSDVTHLLPARCRAYLAGIICTRPVHARGLCAKHYLYRYPEKTPGVTDDDRAAILRAMLPPRDERSAPTVCDCVEPQPQPCPPWPGAWQCARCFRPPVWSLSRTSGR